MTLRIVDSGLRDARGNLSLTEALARGRAAGTTPDTLRFQHFTPSAIIGRHQLLQREVDLDWCAAQGVQTARRMTGGGAIVMGPGLLGWELVLARAKVPRALDDVTALICTAVARAIAGFGLPAAFRPRNDIEVGGRKVSGTGGYASGEVLVFQGTVLVELDLEFMLGALRLPVRKLGKRGLAAMAERVVDLRTLLGAAPPLAQVQQALAAALAAALGRDAQAGAVTAAELGAARDIEAQEIGTEAFVRGHDDALPRAGRLVAHAVQAPGGAIEVLLKLRDGAAPILDQALVTGDFFAEPPGAIATLEAGLRGLPLQEIAAAARASLEATDARFLGMDRAAVVAAVAGAAEAALQTPP
jgi:lipoate-protein ligase A